jgi:uncharacterized Zn ribbon protein
LSEFAALPQKIVDRRIVVLESRLSPAMAGLLGEKMKTKLFAKLCFLKPKPEEIRLVSVDKYYEPHIIISGKYAIDYCKKEVYPVNVDENVQEIVLLDERLKPEPMNQLSEGTQRVIKLNGLAYFHYEDEASFILDKIGREIDPEKLPCAPSEERTVKELAKAGMKFEEVRISREDEIEFLRSKIASRPMDVGEVIREIFEVNERTLIYCPVYQLELMNLKTGKEAILRIDGNTGKATSAKFAKHFYAKDFELHAHASVDEAQIENKQYIDERLFESERDRPELPSRKDSVNSLEETATISNEVVVPPKVSVSEVVGDIGFPASAHGEVFREGDKITVVGDLEIPPKTLIHETIVVKGCLRIGVDCQILGNVEASKNIIIGANTKVEGNVVSAEDVIIGPGSILHGSVESAGHVEVGENAVIEGSLHSKSSVVLNPFAKVYPRDS